MEEVINSTNPFAGLELPYPAESFQNEDTFVITKWNWDYLGFLDFQNKAHSIVRKNKSLKIFIFCNHPHTYTLGRGNERGEEGLVEFDKKAELPYPQHNIHRGGGITFHHPGQWIFYPVVAIKESYSLDDHMCWLLKTVSTTLREDFGLSEVVTAKKLMGVWLNKRKLASIGVGVNRFVTLHGIALTLSLDKGAKLGLVATHPCGMNSKTYTSVMEVMKYNGENLVQDFHKKYLERHSIT